MQEKTSTIVETSARLGLNIHRGKSKILKVNAANTTPIRLEGEALEKVESFTYLGSITDKQGGTDTDIRTHIGKARVAFHQLKNVWGSTDLTINIKIRIFNTIVKSRLTLWSRDLENHCHRHEKNINTCLKRILRI